MYPSQGCGGRRGVVMGDALGWHPAPVHSLGIGTCHFVWECVCMYLYSTFAETLQQGDPDKSSYLASLAYLFIDLAVYLAHLGCLLALSYLERASFVRATMMDCQRDATVDLFVHEQSLVED